jgi:hypothetical protein
MITSNTFKIIYNQNKELILEKWLIYNKLATVSEQYRINKCVIQTGYYD